MIGRDQLESTFADQDAAVNELGAAGVEHELLRRHLIEADVAVFGLQRAVKHWAHARSQSQFEVVYESEDAALDLMSALGGLYMEAVLLGMRLEAGRREGTLCGEGS